MARMADTQLLLMVKGPIASFISEFLEIHIEGVREVKSEGTRA